MVTLRPATPTLDTLNGTAAVGPGVVPAVRDSTVIDATSFVKLTPEMAPVTIEVTDNTDRPPT